MEVLDIDVIETNKDSFLKSVQRLKKLYKVQKNLFQISEEGTVFKDIDVSTNSKKPKIRKVKFYKYKVKYMPLVIDNRHFIVGVLSKNNNKNVISNMNEKYTQYFNKEFLSGPLVCDHCNHKRKRKETFLVFDSKNKKVIRLGKSCLQSYIPMNPDTVKSLLNYTDLFEHSSWDVSNGMQIPTYIPFKQFLANAFRNFDDFGYINRTLVKKDTPDSELPTITLINKQFDSKDFAPIDESKINHFLEFIRETKRVNISFSMRQNIPIFYEENMFVDTFANSLAYLAFRFDEIYQQKILKKTKPVVVNNSKYVGEVGDSNESIITLQKVTGFENNFAYYGGWTNVFTLKDEDDNELIYMGSMDLEKLFKLSEEEVYESELSTEDFVKQHKYKIKYKIKKLAEFNKVKQTHIKNIKLIETID